MSPETTAGKQRGFQPGQSGNPKGRPKGSRHRITVLAEALVDGAAEEIVGKVIERAREADPVALRLLMDRILPVRRDRPTPFALPEINTVNDLPTALAAIAAAVSEGDLTLAEAADASRLLENYARAVEVADLSARIEALEGRANK
jgi:Family of unknown function (DUF5681)